MGKCLRKLEGAWGRTGRKKKKKKKTLSRGFVSLYIKGVNYGYRMHVEQKWGELGVLLIIKTKETGPDAEGLSHLHKTGIENESKSDPPFSGLIRR